MTIDLGQCKHGDKLRTRGGWIVSYSGPSNDSIYPHNIVSLNGIIDTHTNDGRVWIGCLHSYNDNDIVEIVGDDENSILRQQLAAMRKVLHDQALLIADKDVEIATIKKSTEQQDGC